MDRRRKSDAVILHREKLYQEVWETPMRQLAKQYDVSDVGLAKICRKLNIPTPPRGYWAKRASGQAVQKAPLRPLTESGRTQAILDKSAQEVESVAKKRRILKEQRQTEQQKIQRLKAELRLGTPAVASASTSPSSATFPPPPRRSKPNTSPGRKPTPTTWIRRWIFE